MARIPAGEEFGNVIARPQQAPGPVQGANGESIGQALAGFGKDLQRIDQQQLRERRQLQEAADRANADTVLQRTIASLDVAGDELGAGVKGGQVPKDQAGQQWQQQSAELISGVMDSVPMALRGHVRARLDGRAAILGRNVGRAVTERDQADVRAGIDQTMETAQRLYLSDPAQADEMIRRTFEQQGPFSGLDTQQLTRLQQNWRESTRFNKAATMVQDARNSNGTLDQVSKALGGDEFADLTPERRLQLTTQIEGFKTSNIQRAEAARARAEAQQRAHLERAQAAFNTAQGIVMTGKALSPEYITQLSEVVRGTPFAQALPDMVKQAPEMSAYGMQPLPVQDQILQQTRAILNAKGTSPELERRVTQMERINQQSKNDYREEPLLAIQDRGLIQSVAPLDTSSVAAIVQGMSQRTEQARIASGQVGHAVSPLMRTEAEQVAKLLQALPNNQKSTALDQIGAAVGPEMASALGRQIAPKNNEIGISLGMAGDKTTAGRSAAELVLIGAQAIKDRAVKEDSASVTGIRAQVAAQIGDAVVGPARETLINAAVYVQYGLMAEGSGDLDRAVRIATGGITQRGSRKIVLPYGVTPNEFDKKLRQLTPASVAGQLPDGNVYVGKTPVPADEFMRSVPNATLVSNGKNRYNIQAGASLVTNSNGLPVVLEVK